MNRIILVGNGFDLAHNLPTKYEDFIYWYLDARIEKLKNEDSNISKDVLCTFELEKSSLYETWTDFFSTTKDSSFLSNSIDILNYFAKNNRVFATEFTPLFKRIFLSFQTKGWVDVENEYYNLLLSFLKVPKYSNPKELNDELDFIKSKLIEYLTNVQNEKNNEEILNDGIRKKIFEPFNKDDMSILALDYYNHLPQYTLLNASKITREMRFRDNKHPFPDHILILDFNYTKTADMYLKYDRSLIVNHIHGNLDKPDSVIFGYGDELDENYKELSRLNDNEYLHNSKSIKYLESDNYRKVLSFIESEQYQIYIMGHSCGNSDGTLLNTLFEHKNCASIKPFYYKSKEGNDNYLDIVQNISRNFTDMKLMRDRVVNKIFCEPLPQNTHK